MVRATPEPTDPYGPMMRRLLVDAGIRPGMRVLDAGSGKGDVAFMIAKLVGEAGEVVGVDWEPRMISIAVERARQFAHPNVRFVKGDFIAMGDAHGLFDAAVGRRVLMHQANPLDAVRGIAKSVKVGGTLVFQEIDSSSPQGPVDLPLHKRVRGWIWRTLEQSGVHIHMGFRLHSALTAAGLRAVTAYAEALVMPRRYHRRESSDSTP